MDFEEYWKNGCFGEYHDIYAKNLADKFYQAGQQSKQAEIDGLEKKLKYEKLAYKNIKLQFLNKQHDLDGLQVGIDALKEKILRFVESYSTGSDTDDMGDEIKELLK